MTQKKTVEYGGNEAEITYVAGTDLPVKFEGILRQDYGSGKRGDNATEIGNRGGEGYDGGHLGPHRFYRDLPNEGISPQTSNLNRGAYKKMENEWADWTDKGYEVHYEVSPYPPGSEVPTSFDVEYKVIDPDTGAIIDQRAVEFKNVAGQEFDRTYKNDMPDKDG